MGPQNLTVLINKNLTATVCFATDKLRPQEGLSSGRPAEPVDLSLQCDMQATQAGACRKYHYQPALNTLLSAPPPLAIR